MGGGFSRGFLRRGNQRFYVRATPASRAAYLDRCGNLTVANLPPSRADTNVEQRRNVPNAHELIIVGCECVFHGAPFF